MRHGCLIWLLLVVAPAAIALDIGAAAPMPEPGLNGRVVLVDFWASWCAPCRKSFPALDALQKRYGEQGLTVVGVNVDTERAEADRFLAAVPVSFAIVFDAEGKMPERYGVKAMPSSYVVGRDGKLRFANLGFHAKDEEKLEAAVKAALAEPAP